MSTKIPLSVTADEAVARLVNIDYVPEGFTLLEMTAAFQEDAEFDYENARSDHLPDDQKSFLAIRANVCETRHRLAEQLLEALALELESPDRSIIRAEADSPSVAQFDMASVSDWAFDKFGVGITVLADVPHQKDQTAATKKWEDVTIKVSTDNKLGVKFGKGNYKNHLFTDIGLMGKRRDTPNGLAVVLMKLSLGIKFPAGSFAQKSDKKTVSCLRHCLVKVVGIAADPFFPFNAGDGWKPRFKLVDGQQLAERYAEQQEPRETYDDASRYYSQQRSDEDD